MKHDGLNVTEILAYGSLGMVEGLDPAIADRLSIAIIEGSVEVIEDLHDRLDTAEGIIEKISALVG